jgi:endonuclease YncB( thermonuclease family)
VSEIQLDNRPCQVRRVVDGDTLEMGYIDKDGESAYLPGKKVRLLGIDCPKRGEPGGAEATAYVQQWIRTGEVMAIASAQGEWPFRLTVTGLDQHGRLLAELDCPFLGGGERLTSKLLEAKLATVYTRHADKSLYIAQSGDDTWMDL